MLDRLTKLKGQSIQGRDGEIGKVGDFYIDDDDWAIRYLVLDTGGLITGRRMLISPNSITGVDWNDKTVHCDLTRDQVERSPGVGADQPVSRQFEEELSRYYGWPYYWQGPYLWGPYVYPYALSSRTAVGTMERPAQEQLHGDPHLRSMTEVTGYHVQATDGEIGHVEDFVVDDENWQIRYLVVDTSNWWFGKHVLVSPCWARSVSWPERKVFVDLTHEQIKDSPQFDESRPIDRQYEAQLHGHYGRGGYWS